MSDLKNGTPGGIRTHTILILNQTSPASWTTEAHTENLVGEEEFESSLDGF